MKAGHGKFFDFDDVLLKRQLDLKVDIAFS